MTEADRLFYTYCGTDCMVTYECNTVMDSRLLPKQREHYQFNVKLLAPLLYMELRGIRYDHEKAKAKLKRVQHWANVLQSILDRAAGRILPASEEAWVGFIRERLCVAKPRRVLEWDETKTYKNGKVKQIHKRESTPAAIATLDDCTEFALPSEAATMRRVQALLKRGSYTRAVQGELSVLLGAHLKVNATGGEGDAQWFLYERCGFAKQFQKEGNRLTDRLATDDEALIKIFVGEEKKPQPWLQEGVRLKNRGRLALAFLKLRRLITETKTLRADTDADGRMRCGYNLMKRSSQGGESGGPTKTGRLACYESPTGSGFNLQTVTKKHRDLFLADEGCLMAQKDLSGADGWTVAAYAAAQGDRTMLDDYRAGIKPAKVGVLMWQRGQAVNQMDRPALKALCKGVDGDSWQYFGFKRVQHGSSYKMGKFTMADQILTDSWKLTGKPVVIPAAVCEQMQQTCFFARYWGIPRWHRWMELEIKMKGCLVASNGFKRLFFGRKDEHDTIKEALAHLPQVYTTWATELALMRLWTDPENRLPDGSLRCEPLHTVHDSLIDQFKAEDLAWATGKHAEWFNNPILIAQEMIVIPAEGGVGRDWKHLDQGVI